ncbi:DUF998 domain-containing protein [Micromonospora sp. C51]|uniref:DUF998 domain-containing protein n=1 Tax=Micromonospora sp. C51 TaxID=2824879 RepID=UPI001B397EC4|nr:DUF998 domain-containing protein [Micromonospora sp. C51]MBQ1049070.1 DUF998 domain-containing protein [Micromonospora sp. C51]
MPVPYPHNPTRETGQRLAADVALVGLLLPVAAIAAADAVNPQWSWIEHMASYFVHGRAGWLIPTAGVGFAVSAALLIFLVVRLTAARATGGSPTGERLGLWLLGVWAAGMLIAGVFPADPPGHWDRPPSTAAMVHGLGGLTAFLALPVAAVLLTRTWRRDPRWQPVALGLTIAMVLVLAVFVVFVVTWVDVLDGPDLSVGSWYTVVGLVERAMVWSNTGWLVVAVVGLRRMARDG